MYGDLFPEARDTALSAYLQRPQPPEPEPGVFDNMGSAIADALPHAGLTAASVWASMLDAYGKAAAYRDAPTNAILHGETPPEPDSLRKQTIGQIGIRTTGGHAIAAGLREQAKEYQPDPNSVGLAGQIVHGVVADLSKAAAYSTAGGVTGGSLLFGLDKGVGRTQDLMDQGVDADTANSAGLVTGVMSAVGMRMPAAMGATRMQSVAIGGAANPALNVLEIGTIRDLLSFGDYESIAAQYQPLDPVNLAVAAVTGAAFGGAFHRGRPKTGPQLTPDEYAAALTMHEVTVRDADALTPSGNIEAANAARDAQAFAREQIEAGEPVSVATRVQVEQTQIDAAYQRVLDSPAGPAFDPLVHIQPEDIEGVMIARGGMKGINDLEVRGRGFGLVKFIWRHGEESRTPPGYQISRDDLMAFPQIIRELEPTREAAPDGSRGREWRVSLPDENGNLRTVVYADNLINGQNGRHLVTVYVQEPNRVGADAPLSAKRMAIGQNPAAEVGSPTADTARTVTSPDIRGSDQPPDFNVAQQTTTDAIASIAEADSPVSAAAGFVSAVREAAARIFGMGQVEDATPPGPGRKADTPEQVRAFDLATRHPDAPILTGEIDDNGNPLIVRAADLLAELDEFDARARTDAAAFDAAIHCALRFPE